MAVIKTMAERGVLLDWRSGFRMLARSTEKTLAPLKASCRDYLHEAPSTSEIFSCAHALDFVSEGYDGLLHIYAFGCMPQTALKPVLQRIASDSGMPLLSLAIGDRFSEEGLEGRLEAFIDLLDTRKKEGVPS
jgi:predicted nucleotide-binding protein (sugar kinase/HSP70/actin superfamily)